MCPRSAGINGLASTAGQLLEYGENGEAGSPCRFDMITIIFNPNGTGDARKLAKELHEESMTQLPELMFG